MSKPQHWLIKSEPSAYPYAQLKKDRKTLWTGIRSFEARNNLRAMKVGDLALYYHSVEEKRLVGIAQVTSAAGPDPTAPGEDWAAVEVAPLADLVQPVTLAEVKATPAFADFQLITRSRLSVAPVSPEHFKRILKMGRTKL
jgi:predicted RNA-binding protein with PUA-like domain